MKTYTILAAAALLAFGLAGCGKSGGGSSGSGGTGASSVAGGIQLAFVTNNASDYWTICRKGVEAAQKDLPGVNVQFVMPDDGSAATQKRDVDDLLAKGVKGIAISPVDPTNETAYLNQVAGKANLITSDSDAADSKRLCYLGTDNHAAGVMAGELIKKALPSGGKIVLFVGKRDAQNAKDREQGIRDAIKGTSITILDVRTDDADHGRAKANAADALVKYPDVAGLVGLWSYNAPAILSAVKDAGKVGKVKIVAFDQEEDTINGLKSGAIFGTIVQQPYQFGYQSVKLLASLAMGDKKGIPANKLIIIPTQAITPTNVAAYMVDQDKLLEIVMVEASADNEATLSVTGITKRFAGVAALKGVNLSIRRGEIVALIGENGAGKLTLMKILGGVHQPDEGAIIVGGRPTVIRNVKEAIAAGISFIHQELNVLDNIDVAGNVFLGREPLVGGPLKLIDSARMYAETAPLLDRLGLNIDPRVPVRQLSIAQQQMVEIAKALSLNAQILIMDEPTSSLTLTETARLMEVAKDLREHGVSIIYISHRLGEVMNLADRVVALRDGANAGGLEKGEINHDAMVRLMVGRDIARQKAAESVGDRPVRLSVKGLRTKRYPQSEVSFDIYAGEILGMAGLVGAGRSEVAQAIFGVDTGQAGSLTLDGQPIRIRSAQDAIARGIYLAPEDRRKSGLIVEMSIRENITLPALPRYATAGLINRRDEGIAAESAAKSLGVRAPNTNFIVKNLSGGNQQKVVLAKWLSLGPKVLIFDEPTRGIDVGAKAEIYDLMRKLSAEGVGILMISSDMEEVLGLSDRIAVMHEGQLSGILTSAQASEESVMQLAVGGQAPGATIQ